MSFQRLSILGVGLLGGSIGLAVRSSSRSCKITGYGRNHETLQAAKRLGAIDEAALDPVKAVQGADLVILCTPVGVFGQLLSQIGPALAAGAVVTDVGSTKRSVCALAEKTLASGVSFVGSHPMAGSEKRGVEAARADLFKGALCITTPTPKTDSAVLGRVESFWQGLGMRVTRQSPDDHDRMLAEISHLPHALAAALVAMQSEEAMNLAGRGFLDATRIAGGDGALWRDILLDNADNMRQSLKRLRGQLDRFEAMLDPANAEALRQWLDTAAAKRRARTDSSTDTE